MIFTADVIEGAKKIGDFHQEKIEILYDEMASEYEKVYIALGHPDPEECGNMAQKFLG